MSNGLTPKVPLVRDTNSFKSIQNFQDLIRQNFKNLILTIPGERVMDLDFGVGILQYLFEPNDTRTYSLISAKIKSQAKKYLPYIKILDITLTPRDDKGNIIEDGFVSVVIQYFIEPLQTSDVVDITLPNTN